MNRCDFSSISTCLKNHISESNQMSQPDFLYELFEDFMDDPANQDFSMDNGLVCRWMTGQAKISPKISAYYSKPSNQEKLAHTIHQNLLPLTISIGARHHCVLDMGASSSSFYPSLDNKTHVSQDIFYRKAFKNGIDFTKRQFSKNLSVKD